MISVSGHVHVIRSPFLRSTVGFVHTVPNGWTSTLAPPGAGCAGSVAANVTVTGSSYVPPAPGAAGASVAVEVGASVSSPTAGTILNAIVLIASTLPALSTERYSIE